MNRRKFMGVLGLGGVGLTLVAVKEATRETPRTVIAKTKYGLVNLVLDEDAEVLTRDQLQERLVELHERGDIPPWTIRMSPTSVEVETVHKECGVDTQELMKIHRLHLGQSYDEVKKRWDLTKRWGPKA